MSDSTIEVEELDAVAELLQGAIDLHVHSAPDLLPRIADDIELVARFSKREMGGFVLKSHYFPTVERASIVNAFSSESPRVHGALCLNQFVGGFNPYAVEAALRGGAAIIWMPTVDAANEHDLIANASGTGLPPYIQLAVEMRERGIEAPPLSVLDETGAVVPAVQEIVRLVGEHGRTLATGHIGALEVLALVRLCGEVGVRVIVTHPESRSISIDLAMQQELVGHGAIVERCVAYCRSLGVWDLAFEGIRRTGVAQNVFSSDFGGLRLGYPDDGMSLAALHLRQAGFTDDEVRRLVRDNPRQIVG